MSPRQPINWFLLNTIYFFDAISIQARQYTTSIWIHHSNMCECVCYVCLCWLCFYIKWTNKQTYELIWRRRRRTEKRQRYGKSHEMLACHRKSMHTHSNWLTDCHTLTHLLGFLLCIKINRDICNCCEWQTINHLLPRSLHATRSRARTHSFTFAWSPLQHGLNLFDLFCLVWLGWLVDCLTGLYNYMLCVYCLFVMYGLFKSNQIKIEIIVKVHTSIIYWSCARFPFWLLRLLLLLLFARFPLSIWGFC